MSRRSIWSVIIPMAVSVAVSGTADAQAAPKGLPVSATVKAFCDIGGSAEGALVDGRIDFGSHPISTGLTLLVSGQMPIRCNSANALPMVTLDNGLNAAGTQRNLKGPTGALIGYELLRGATADSPRWDDQGYAVPLTSNQTELVAIYGLISAIPDGTVDGHYSDTVEVQVDY